VLAVIALGAAGFVAVVVLIAVQGALTRSSRAAH
jgi:hypothetical protein